MRYERTEDILKLAIHMQTSYRGLSLNDIQELFRVSRRTAERMRDAVVRLFPHIEEVETGTKVKRWTLRKHSLSPLVSFNPEELAELENTRNKYASEGLKIKADATDEIITKIKVISNGNKSKLETDVEALLEAEGFAIRQHPRFKIEKEIFYIIREAIKAFKVIEIEYEKGNKKIQVCKVHPYGMLYGEKHFLVAHNEQRQALRLYNLVKIKSIKLLDEYFDRDEAFNLIEYSQKSFGVYQEEPFNVVLEFDKEVAENVKNFHFHPTQTMQEQEDGNVRVEFSAGGSKAICWHLFKWGKFVKIIEPQGIKEIYKDLLEEASQSI